MVGTGIAEGAAAFGVLKSAYELVRDLRKSNDPAQLKAGLEELTDRLLAAREDAFKTAEEFDKLVAENKHLRAELERQAAWITETDRYNLCEITPGAFAYLLKDGEVKGGPNPLLCATCFDHGKKSIMQRRDAAYTACPNCQTVIQEVPDKRWNSTVVETDYDPFGRY